MLVILSGCLRCAWLQNEQVSQSLSPIVHPPLQNIKHLLELIDSATLLALWHLIRLDAFGCLGVMNPDMCQEQARDILRQRLRNCLEQQLDGAELESRGCSQLMSVGFESLQDHASTQLSAWPSASCVFVYQALIA